MDNILLIDDSDITTISGSKINVEASKFTPHIMMAQNLFLEPILGEELYLDFLEKWDDKETIPLTPEYETLYNKIRPCVVWRALSDSIDDIHNELTNKGVQNRNSDYSTNANDTRVYRKINKMVRWAEFYEKNLLKFLNDNKDIYPLFDGNKCNDGRLTDEFYFEVLGTRNGRLNRLNR